MYWIVWDGQMVEGATGRRQKQQPGFTTVIPSLVNHMCRLCNHHSDNRMCNLLSAAMRVRCTSPCSVTMRQVRGPWCWRTPSLRKSSSRWRRRWYTSLVHASPRAEEPQLMTLRSRYLCLYSEVFRPQSLACFVTIIERPGNWWEWEAVFMHQCEDVVKRCFHVDKLPCSRLSLCSGWFRWGGKGGWLQQGNSGPVMWTCKGAAHQQHPPAVEKTEEPYGEARQPRYM